MYLVSIRDSTKVKENVERVGGIRRLDRVGGPLRTPSDWSSPGGILKGPRDQCYLSLLLQQPGRPSPTAQSRQPAAPTAPRLFEASIAYTCTAWTKTDHVAGNHLLGFILEL